MESTRVLKGYGLGTLRAVPRGARRWGASASVALDSPRAARATPAAPTEHRTPPEPAYLLRSENTSTVLACRFSPDGQFVAIGCHDGTVKVRALAIVVVAPPRRGRRRTHALADTHAVRTHRSCDASLPRAQVFDATTGRFRYMLGKPTEDSMPVTGLEWRPVSSALDTKNVLIVAGTDGMLRHWHVTGGRVLRTTGGADDQLLCVDVQPDGLRCATAGKYVARANGRQRSIGCVWVGGCW